MKHKVLLKNQCVWKGDFVNVAPFFLLASVRMDFLRVFKEHEQIFSILLHAADNE